MSISDIIIQINKTPMDNHFDRNHQIEYIHYYSNSIRTCSYKLNSLKNRINIHINYDISIRESFKTFQVGRKQHKCS